MNEHITSELNQLPCVNDTVSNPTLMKVNENSQSNKKMDDLCDESISSEQSESYECRTCLHKIEPPFARRINLFEAWNVASYGTEPTPADELAKLANIELSETDEHSKFICEKCSLKLQNASQFVFEVQKNDIILRERCIQNHIMLHVDSEGIWPKPIDLNKNVNDSLYQNVDIEIKQEAVSCDETINGIDDRLSISDIKIEPEDMIQNEHIHAYSISSPNDLNTMTNGIGNGVHVKEEPLSESEDMLSLEIPLECILCAKVFKKISGLKAHVIAQHSYKSVKRKADDAPSPMKCQAVEKYVCATCSRCFSTSTDLMVHETRHNKDKCYGCNKSFDTFEQLSKHRRKCKALKKQELQKLRTLEDVQRPPPKERMKDNLFKDGYTCDKCGAQFNEMYYLGVHQEIHYSGRSELITEPNNGTQTDTLHSIFNDEK